MWVISKDGLFYYRLSQHDLRGMDIGSRIEADCSWLIICIGAIGRLPGLVAWSFEMTGRPPCHFCLPTGCAPGIWASRPTMLIFGAKPAPWIQRSGRTLLSLLPLPRAPRVRLLLGLRKQCGPPRPSTNPPHPSTPPLRGGRPQRATMPRRPRPASASCPARRPPRARRGGGRCGGVGP